MHERVGCRWIVAQLCCRIRREVSLNKQAPQNEWRWRISLQVRQIFFIVTQKQSVLNWSNLLSCKMKKIRLVEFFQFISLYERDNCLAIEYTARPTFFEISQLSQVSQQRLCYRPRRECSWAHCSNAPLNRPQILVPYNNKGSRRNEKRIMLDIYAAVQAYKFLVISNIEFVRSNDNIADGLTKQRLQKYLFQLNQARTHSVTFERSILRNWWTETWFFGMIQKWNSPECMIIRRKNLFTKSNKLKLTTQKYQVFKHECAGSQEYATKMPFERLKVHKMEVKRTLRSPLMMNTLAVSLKRFSVHFHYKP